MGAALGMAFSSGKGGASAARAHGWSWDRAAYACQAEPPRPTTSWRRAQDWALSVPLKTPVIEAVRAAHR